MKSFLFTLSLMVSVGSINAQTYPNRWVRIEFDFFNCKDSNYEYSSAACRTMLQTYLEELTPNVKYEVLEFVNDTTMSIYDFRKNGAHTNSLIRDFHRQSSGFVFSDGDRWKVLYEKNRFLAMVQDENMLEVYYRFINKVNLKEAPDNPELEQVIRDYIKQYCTEKQ